MEVKRKVKKITVALKPSLVKSKLPLILTYADAKPGMRTHGYVASVKEYGCFINFYNRVSGLLPVSNMSSSHIDNAIGLYSVGQTLSCRVVNADAKHKKITLTMLVCTPLRLCKFLT